MTVKDSVKIGKLNIKNRIVRAATNDYRGNEDGTVSCEQLDIYKKLAETEIGLIISGNFAVTREGRIDGTMNGFGSVDECESAKRLTETVHKYDKHIFAQLVHAGCKSKIYSIYDNPYGNVNALSRADIHVLTGDFARAAYYAKRTGFDGVEIHFSHGYLLSDFLNPKLNIRTDEYGLGHGEIKIIGEVIRRTRILCGDDFPIIVKISSRIPGLSEESNLFFLHRVIKEFDEAGVDGFELSGLDIAEHGFNDHLYYEMEMKEIRRDTVKPIILTGGIRTNRDCNEAMVMGADLLGFSRPFIRNPYFAEDLLLGKESRCVSCNRCYTLKERGGKRCVYGGDTE